MNKSLHYPAKIGLILLVGLILFALLTPLLSSHSYYTTQLPLKNQPPSSAFWFGTDELGRDLLTRSAWGARISLLIGFSATLLDLFIGVLFGAIAGWMGGKTEEWMMRCVDILYAIPYLLVVILLMVVMGPGLLTMIVALAMIGWINMARMVRGQVIQLKQMEYVKAAMALGASRRRLLAYHLIPNALGPILVTVTFTIPSAIFTEAFLSFLGLGVQAPIASWGTMIHDGLPALRYYPWRLFIPATLLSLTILSFHLIGDSLKEFLDPRRSC